MRKTALPLLFLLLSGICFAQTPTIYNASNGTIQSTFVSTMFLDDGGTVTVNPNLGPYCYYPGPCDSSYASFSYTLADGSTASFYPVVSHFVASSTGTCLLHGRPVRCTIYTVTLDQASSIDNLGNPVQGNLTFTVRAQPCTQPRGTCPPKIVYSGGSLTLVQ